MNWATKLVNTPESTRSSHSEYDWQPPCSPASLGSRLSLVQALKHLDSSDASWAWCIPESSMLGLYAPGGLFSMVSHSIHHVKHVS